MDEAIDSKTLWVGYELNSNEQVKNIIKSNINHMCNNWISIGFALKQARDKEFYKEDGYSSIQDYAYYEFGIKKQRASKLVKIVETLSVNGNSPVLEDKWKDFSISKLEEIIYLDEEERESVNPIMTKVQIRDIGKKNDEPVSPAKLEHETTAPDQLGAMIPVIDFTRSIDSLAKEFEEKSDCPPGVTSCRRIWPDEGYYDRKKNGPCQDCIRCWKDWLTSEKIKTESADRQEVPKQEKPVAEPTQIEQGYVEPKIRNTIIRAYIDSLPDWKKDNIRKVFAESTNVDERINYLKSCTSFGDVRLRLENDIRRLYLRKVNEEELELSDWHNDFAEYAPGVKILIFTFGEMAGMADGMLYESKLNNISITVDDTPEIADNQPKIVNDVDEDDNCSRCQLNGNADAGILECHPGKGEHKCWIDYDNPDKSEQVETVEADIIQTVPEEDEEQEAIDPELYTCQDIGDELNKLIEYVGMYRKNNDTAPGRRKAKMRLDAIVLLDEKMRKPPVIEEPDPVQPELPVLKNNDQRKEWIDNYETWPIWIDIPQTGERYYRYDFDNGTSFVIRVSLQHAYKGYERTKDIKYAHEEYFLLGVKDKWIPGMPTFVESSTNKSAMVEHLKEIQKKGG